MFDGEVPARIAQDDRGIRPADCTFRVIPDAGVVHGAANARPWINVVETQFGAGASRAFVLAGCQRK